MRAIIKVAVDKVVTRSESGVEITDETSSQPTPYLPKLLNLTEALCEEESVADIGREAVEVYSDRKGNLSTKTYYKTKKDAAQRVMKLKSSLLPTSETYSGAILSETKIPQIFELPKIEARNSLITPEMDAVYLSAVERGDMETAQQMVMEAAKLAMPNTKVVDENGNPKVVYHGTPNIFTVFDTGKIGSSTGTADGRGFYFTTDKDYAQGFATPEGKIFGVFLNIENPLSYDRKTITKAQLEKIFKEADEVEFESEGEHYMLSNYADYTTVGIQGAIKEGANLEYNYADNDVELIGSIIAGSGSFELIMNAVQKVTGKSSMIAPKANNTTHYIVTDPKLIKSADPVTYDDAGNVIPLSERFNPEKEDIRYSLPDVEAERFNRKVNFIKDMAREYNIPNPVFIAETKAEFVQMVKDYGGEVGDDTAETYGMYIPNDDIILLNGGKLITSGDAHRSTMHEYAHSITKKYLGERLAEITSSISEAEIDKARKEMLPEAYRDYSYSEVIDEFTSLLLEDLSIAETRAIFEGEMTVDTFIEKLKNDIKGIEKISNKDILYAVIPLVVDNLKIQKEQYGKDPESTIIIPRQDSRRYTTLGQASHLWGDKKSRPSEAESRVYEDSRGGESTQKEAVATRYQLPDPDPSEAFYDELPVLKKNIEINKGKYERQEIGSGSATIRFDRAREAKKSNQRGIGEIGGDIEGPTTDTVYDSEAQTAEIAPRYKP